MKVYAIDVRYYIQAENGAELEEVLEQTGIKYNEYYCGYDVVDIEEEEDYE